MRNFKFQFLFFVAAAILFAGSFFILEPAGAAPEPIKAVYATSWSASKAKYIDYLINLASTTEINAVVIDVKDYSGYVAYDTRQPEVAKYKARQIRIRNIDSLIKRLHEAGIYVIARISVFQDPVLAAARPDLAIHSRAKLNALGATSSIFSFSTSTLWLDRQGLAWIDPASREARQYNINIAKDVASRGFDELNFDYVRFPTGGDLKDVVFPFFNATTSKNIIIKQFFRELRLALPDTKLSVDLFGLSTISRRDLGVGQIIEDAFEYFDYVSPMLYPSHYDSGFLGYENPAEFPYEVVKYSLEKALKRISVQQELCKSRAVLRPWLQDFSLKTAYDAEKVKAQIRAVQDATGKNFSGFMLWNSKNIYTAQALQPENISLISPSVGN